LQRRQVAEVIQEIAPEAFVVAKGFMNSTVVISHKPESIWQYANPLHMARNLWAYRDLLRQFTRREVLGRYKGSYLGILWSFLTPFLMLAVYTFVFSVVFGARWGNSPSESRVEFALTLFCGLIAFNVFSECISRAPGLIVGNPNYVKRVVFPLEILPVSVLGAALIQSLINVVIVVVGILIFMRTLSWTLVCLPLAYLPLVGLCLGLGWFLASLGVFIRGIGYVVGIAVQVLFFVTPIFYPISAMPPFFQLVLRLNPLSEVVEGFRRVMMWGQPPDWPWWGAATIVSALAMVAGYTWFMKLKRAFADVV
jgi:lipopolysaccharide transport system permease protein